MPRSTSVQAQAPSDSPARQPGPPVLAVKIDNAPEARPPIGLADADEIFIEPVEGGLSRLCAIFGARKPPVVGPVRSARETDLQLLPQFGHPSLAFSGAAPQLLPQIDRSPLHNASDANAPGAYFRDDSREIPHNLFLRTDRVPEGDPWSAASQPVFGPTPSGGKPTEHRDIRYPAATVSFDWSASEHRWLVSMDGRPYSSTDGGRLGPPTVVIQHVAISESSIKDAAGNTSPIAETTGTGRAEILRDGQSFDAVWSRPSAVAPTTYATASGQPLSFASGQVWVVLTE